MEEGSVPDQQQPSPSLWTFPTPLDWKLTLSYVALGFLSAADNLMYAYAYAYSPHPPRLFWHHLH
ncbi:hypothetical protein L484_009918 [Morus notabilis]|uniref:Uncharacterized protein n=1 Tax=Morus notabilis TaxID=981085 RepID=W9QIX8_9ROSA|nr:hypothetical protein L484_009918 [Morus notabilis]